MTINALTASESVYNRVKDGTEKILLYKTESKIGLVDEGVERTAGLSISKNKKLSELLGFVSKSLFIYSLKNFSSSRTIK